MTTSRTHLDYGTSDEVVRSGPGRLLTDQLAGPFPASCRPRRRGLHEPPYGGVHRVGKAYDSRPQNNCGYRLPSPGCRVEDVPVPLAHGPDECGPRACTRDPGRGRRPASTRGSDRTTRRLVRLGDQVRATPAVHAASPIPATAMAAGSKRVLTGRPRRRRPKLAATAARDSGSMGVGNLCGFQLSLWVGSLMAVPR